MITRLRFEPLKVSHLDKLSSVLLVEEVYGHIEDHVSLLDEFKLALTRAISGLKTNSNDQTWLNYLARDERTDEMLGRLEATVHNSIAEVAFLFSPSHSQRLTSGLPRSPQLFSYESGDLVFNFQRAA